MTQRNPADSQIGAASLGAPDHGGAARLRVPDANPPAQITRADYRAWLTAIESNISEFFDLTFDWYEEQLHSALPPNVGSDPKQLYVDVDRALHSTIDLEQQGTIDEGDAMGFDAYGAVDVSISVGLETTLFYFGKPVGKPEGDTHPIVGVFASSHFTIERKWGPDSYLSGDIQTGGGLVQDLNDYSTVLVRGEASSGYVVISSFLAKIPEKGSTATTSQLFVSMLKPLSDEKIEFRHSLRRRGQSYKAFGLDYGRREIAFNAARFREGELQVIANMINLKNTGKIPERRPNP